MIGSRKLRIEIGIPVYCNKYSVTVEFRFLDPEFFELPDNSKQKSLPSPQSNTVILPSISRTIQFFGPIFVSLGSLKNRDSTIIAKKAKKDKNQVEVLISTQLKRSGWGMQMSVVS